MPGPEDIAAQAAQLVQSGRPDAAESLLRRGLQRAPAHPDLNHIMALCQMVLSRPQQAEYFASRAAAADPNRAQFRLTLGNALFARGDAAKAEDAYRAALAIDPRYSPAAIALSRALVQRHAYDQAAQIASAALSPDRPDAAQAAIAALVLAGRVPEAAELFRTTAAAFPDHPGLRAGLPPDLHFSPHDRADVFAQHVRAGRAIAELAAHDGPTPPFTQSRDPDRPLKIAYISADFCTHSVAYFFDAALSHRDRAVGPVTLYFTGHTTDAVTERFRSRADAFVHAANLSDPALFDRIRADRIDVLVDLAGRTAGERLPVLARRAAPVQVTYLGYPDTTGVPNVDYRIVDSRTDPPGEPFRADRFATEQLVRLDPCFICYTPPDAPEPSRDAGGPPVFGSFAAMPKINDDVVALWASIVAATPGARLMLKGRALASPSVAERTRARFAAAGLAADRLELMGQTVSPREHLALYSRVDISLDTLPYSGTTTTCESLYMGVPVVTCPGESHASRVTAALLELLGLTELIADSPSDMQRRAIALATDAARLRDYRATLRPRMLSSPLCDGPAFARRLESAYRTMWRSWCAAGR